MTARVVNTYMLNNGENSFDIASLNAGVYHIQVEHEGVITNLKFVKN